MSKKFKFLKRFLFLTVICLSLTGCKTPQDVAYFQDINEQVIPVGQNSGQIKIKPLDKLSIVIKSKDPELAELFNLSVNSSRLGQTSTIQGGNATVRSYSGGYEGMSNYTVTTSGDIDFPVLGMIHVEGMTREQLAAFIKGDLVGKGLVKDPVVTVEFLNTGYSVMGEVNSPGRFDINKDKLNILEALAIAGDLTIQGQRNNITVLREEKDGVHTYKLDLTNLQDLTKSPAYYVQQSDVIYVEPNDIRKRQTTANGNNVLSTGFWISVASLLTSVVTTIGVFVVK